MPATDLLTEKLKTSLENPRTSPEFEIAKGVADVLGDVGMGLGDGGGKLEFYGADPIVASPFRFGTMAAIGLAAKSIAAAAIWKDRTGAGQDISVDVRKSVQRFAGFFDGKWEQVNGRPPELGPTKFNPFFSVPLFRETRDGRHVVALSIYPEMAQRCLNFLNCSPSSESIQAAVRQWNSDELELAAAAAGLVIAKVRTNEEFRQEQQYTDVLSTMPLIRLEKIADSDPIPFSPNPKAPLDGIRALGMGHVIAGAAIGRDLAYYGADVLNTWGLNSSEIEPFAWDVQVGMRSTILGHSTEDRAKFDELLQGADVFFANKRAGYLERHGLDAEALAAKRPGLIHATIVLHGDTGPWANRPGFDEVGAAVAGIFTHEGSLAHPSSPVIIPICDNVVGWLATVGVMQALRRRAVEGGSYRVVVSLTRSVLWLMSLGVFDKDYAKAMAGSSDAHSLVPPDLFTADTPLGTYQGMTDQVVMSRTPGAFKTVLVPRGSSKPEWLAQ